MKKTKKMNRTASNLLHLHPFLFVLYPLFYFINENFFAYQLHYMVTASIVLISLVIILFIIFSFWLPFHKNAVITSLVVITLFSANPIMRFLLLEKFTYSNYYQYLIIHALFSAFLLSLTVVAFFQIRKTQGSCIVLNQCFCLTSFLMLIFIFFNILKNPTIKFFTDSSYENHIQNISYAPNINNENLPDIYYIILDMYPSNETLLKYFNHDNTYFTEKLKQLGFYVAKDSKSNYSNTITSMSSTLNLDYMVNENKVTEKNWNFFRRKLAHPELISIVKKYGYRTIIFSDPSFLEENLVQNTEFHPNKFSWYCLSFYRGLINMTLFDPFFERFFVRPDYARLKLEGLKKLESIHQESGPKFVYFHLESPHPPYVISKNGLLRLSNEREHIGVGSLFIDTVSYVNSRIITAIESILENSDIDPIIVIQGDHGISGLPSKTGPREHDANIDIHSTNDLQARFGILNAYYVPSKLKNQLYHDISPVNSFRLVLSEILNEKMPLLEDKHYYVMANPWWNNFDALNVTDKF